MVDENDKGPIGPFDVELLTEPITALAERFSQLQARVEPVLVSADQKLAAAENRR